MCSVHPCAGRGLRLVQIAAKAPVVRLCLRSTLEGKASLGACKFGIGARSLGFAQALSASSFSATSRRPSSSFSAFAADILSIRLRLLFFAADLSCTTSVCCIRKRSIIPSSHRLSAANSKVRAPDAIRSTKAAACHQTPSNSASHKKNILSKTTYVFQLLRNRAHHVLGSGGRCDLAAGAKLGQRILRIPLRHGDQPSRHQRRDNSQLPSLRPYTIVSSKKLTNKSPPYMGVEHRDAAHKKVIHGNIHGDFDPTHLRLSGTPRGRRPLLRHGHDRKRLARAGGGGLRAQRRLAGSWGSRLRDPPSHLDLAPRVPDPRERPSLLRRILAILFHHCRYNSSNILSVRKNLHLTS
jgi:hypothetical protein